MIRSLEDANEWYNAVKQLALDMQHLASRCDESEWEAVMRRDNRLGTRSAAELNKMAEIVLGDLDDLAVLVLFSVFEATVRTQAVTDVDRQMEGINHVAIVKAVENLKDAIKNGSFAKVTGAYKN